MHAALHRGIQRADARQDHALWCVQFCYVARGFAGTRTAPAHSILTRRAMPLTGGSCSVLSCCEPCSLGSSLSTSTVPENHVRSPQAGPHRASHSARGSAPTGRDPAAANRRSHSLSCAPVSRPGPERGGGGVLSRGQARQDVIGPKRGLRPRSRARRTCPSKRLGGDIARVCTRRPKLPPLARPSHREP